MAEAIGRSIAGVCVGVDRTGVLYELQAAAKSAVQFRDWLLTQRERGVEVEARLLTDDAKGSVTYRNIADAVRDLAKNGGYDVLFLYLSGHGIVQGSYDEKFLLSDVANYETEAIDLHKSIQHAKRCGIPHVVFIYDACRSPAPMNLRQISGGSVVPVKPKASGSHVDVFFACGPDESAYEPEKQAFFTRILLGVLENPPAELIERAKVGKQSFDVISSVALERFLEREVPKLAAGFAPPFDQSPDVEVLSHMPSEFFAVTDSTEVQEESYGVDAGGGGGEEWVERSPIRRGRAPRSKPKADRSETGTGDLVQWHARQVFGREPVLRKQTPKKLRKIEEMSGFDRVVKAVRQARGRESFETHTGFTVIGATISQVSVSGNKPAELEPDGGRPGVTHIRVGEKPWNVRPGTAVIEFAGGAGVVLGIMPGYIGTVVVENGGLDVLAYAPSIGSAMYKDYKRAEKQLLARRALATAAASVSKLQELAKSEGRALAGHVRVGKGYDPSLGILAAYAYYLAGDEQSVQSVCDWMARTRVNPNGAAKPILAPVPFDVAMLAGRANERGIKKQPGLAPCCPMFSFGWSLLEVFGVKLPDRVAEAGRYRRPGTWTLFDKKGIQLFQEALGKGEIE